MPNQQTDETKSETKNEQVNETEQNVEKNFNEQNYEKEDKHNEQMKETKDSMETMDTKLTNCINNNQPYPNCDKVDIKDSPLVEETKIVKKFSPLCRQTLTVAGAIMCTITAGLTSGYSATLLPQLEEPGSPISIDEDTKSWIASMASLPMGIGCLISGWLMERFGRKTSHQILCVPFFIGWILIYFTYDINLMLAGRFFTGICVGLLGPLTPVYLAEISDPKYRGFFLAAVSLAIAMGVFIAHIIGTFLDWKICALIYSTFPLLSFSILTFAAESPSWLISKDREREGIDAFYWLRGYGENMKMELTRIIENHDRQKIESENLTLKEKFANLKKPSAYKPLVIMIIFFITAQFSGVNAVAFYCIEIMSKTLGKGFDKYLGMLIIDIVRVVMSVIACVLVRRYGRRPLQFISSSFTCISLFGLSTFLYLTKDKDATSLSFIPLSLLIIYICAISVGIVPLPWLMCGELFPVKFRGIGSGISSAIAFTSFFVVVKTAPMMFRVLGEIGTYMAYGVVCFIGTFILYFILPETKGKSLQEIEDKFDNVKKDDSENKA